ISTWIKGEPAPGLEVSLTGEAESGHPPKPGILGPVLGLYHAARCLGLRPALLESLGIRAPFSRLSLLGLKPAHRLE
ncbi:hypothetical protein BZG30_33465, partial [Escherichia coli]|nr:hypothetical protein [Escherichia coli]